MFLDPTGHSLGQRNGGACRCVLKNLADLRCGDAREQLNKLRQRDSVLEVLKEGRHWNPGVTKHPGTTQPVHIPLDCRAFSPVQKTWFGDSNSPYVNPIVTRCNDQPALGVPRNPSIQRWWRLVVISPAREGTAWGTWKAERNPLVKASRRLGAEP